MNAQQRGSIPTIPRRSNARGTSVLFALEPRGLGTAFVESLTGYWRRLALLHVKPHALLLERVVLAPHRRDYPDDAGVLMSIAGAGQGLNGGRSMGAVITGELEALTWVPTIRRTTLYGLTEFWMRDTFRDFRAWCPDCLKDDDSKPYDRLVWALRPYTVCVVHGRSIIDACPSCGTRRRPFRADVQPTICGRCEGWLTAAADDPRPVDAMSQLTLDFVARIQSGRPITRAQIASGAAHVVATAGSYPAARAGGFSVQLLHRMIHGTQRISVGPFLQVIARSGEDLQTFLAHPFHPTRQHLKRFGHRRTRSRTARHGPAAVAALRALLADPTTPVPTVTAFCADHRVSGDWLRRAEPSLMAQLVARGKRQRRTRSQQRQLKERQELEQEIRKIHAQEGRLTIGLVNARLGKAGQLRDRALSIAAHDLIAQLQNR